MKEGEQIYIYDGSFEGFLTCVFDAFENKTQPADIRKEDDTIFSCVYIETDAEKAKRVKKWMTGKLGAEYAELVALAYLSGEKDAEINSFKYLLLLHKNGVKEARNLCDPLVYYMTKLGRSVRREAHRIIEFLRFSDYGGNLVSVINPKYFVLPLISKHFEKRFPNENYFIFDEEHGAALSHEKSQTVLFSVKSFTAPDPTEEEERFRKLWKLFYDTIEIKSRRNHKLRMQHMPKRFWKNVTELCGEL